MNRQPHLPTTAAPPTGRQHKSRWRWLLGVVALVGLSVFLPQLILIEWGPHLLGMVLSKQWHTLVTVEGVSGGWLSGLEIRGIEVAEGPEPQAPRLLRLEQLTLNLAAVDLLVASDPMVLRMADLTVNVRRGEDGQWNTAAWLTRLTQPTPPAAPKPPLPPLLDQRIDAISTGGRLHLEDDGITYSFDLHAERASRAAAPWQWHFALSGPAGTALTVDGQLQHLTSSEPLVGHIEVNVTQLDIAVVTSLLPLSPAVPPRGRVPSAHIRLGFAGTQGGTIAAGLEFQHLQWPAASEPATAGIERLQIHLQGQWQDNQWSCDTLTIEAPHGRFALHDRAWMQADEDAWRGHAAFALDVKESQRVTQALQALLPPDLRSQGSLQITGKAGGAVSRDAQQPWDARLTGFEASLEASLAQVTWRQEAFTTVMTKVFLKDGILTIPQASARAFGSDMLLKGDLRGRFVKTLAPEVPVQFTHPLHVSGPYSIRLQGNVWVGMQWDLAVTSDRFVFADMSFTDLETRVVKAIGQREIADVKAKRGQGRLEGAGVWHFVHRGQPAEGDLHLLDFRSQGAGTLHLRTACHGEAQLQVTPSGQLHGGGTSAGGQDDPPGTAS